MDYDRQIQRGTTMITDKMMTVNATEKAINTLIELFEYATHWKVKNKPIKLDIDDRFKRS